MVGKLQIIYFLYPCPRNNIDVFTSIKRAPVFFAVNAAIQPYI